MSYLTATAAQAAIEAILNALPDEELPELRIEEGDREPCAWHGGMGFYLGSAKRDGEDDPSIHRQNGIRDALVQEAVMRADIKYLAERDA